MTHRDRWFLPLLRGAEVGDIDVVLLDAYTVIAVFTDAEESYHLQQLRIMAAAALARTQG